MSRIFEHLTDQEMVDLFKETELDFDGSEYIDKIQVADLYRSSYGEELSYLLSTSETDTLKINYLARKHLLWLEGYIRLYAKLEAKDE